MKVFIGVGSARPWVMRDAAEVALAALLRGESVQIDGLTTQLRCERFMWALAAAATSRRQGPGPP